MFVTDLDGTVVFSSDGPVTSTCVEEINGKKIYTSDVFLSWLRFQDLTTIKVANTARSKEEFERLSLSKYFKYAIVANGGLILKDGKPLEAWEQYLNRNHFMPTLRTISKQLDARIVDDSYIHTKRDKLKEVYEILEDYPSLSLYVKGSKVYISPHSVSKVKSMLWLKYYLNESKIIASGDSLNDIEMLEQADTSIIVGDSIVSLNKPYHRVHPSIVGTVSIVNLIKEEINNGVKQYEGLN